MKKIPVQTSAALDQPAMVSPRFLMEALETLLLGAVWLFVLVWMPYFQNGGDLQVPESVQTLQWLVVLGLASVLIVVRLAQGRAAAGQWMPLGFVVVIAGLSLAMMLMQDLSQTLQYRSWVSVLQSLLGLGYFVSVRLHTE
ncbi:MAG: hypothetical protein GY938_14450 [Ketobacter sp.]|nr:hypothetical protein [Ketobacter sp.]